MKTQGKRVVVAGVVTFFASAILALNPAHAVDGGNSVANSAQQEVPMVRATDAPTEMTDEEKIENAMSGGPDAITQDATLLEWPTEPGGEFNVLREGTNGWSCIISGPGAVAKGQNNAYCHDEVWLAWEHALMEGRTPEVDRLGVSYSLSNTAEGSNTDPAATGPTEDNGWHMIGPHIALLVPDPALFEGISTDPHNGGTYVMWAGTPYAHIMLPVEPYPED